MNKLIKYMLLLMSLCCLLSFVGCGFQFDPPPLSDFPKYDHRVIAESDDFQDALWYGEYSFENYSIDEMNKYLEKAKYFKQMTEEDILSFYSFQHTFDTGLQECEVVGTSKELIEIYFDDEVHVTKSIPLDTNDYFCRSEYGFFVYETTTKKLYGLNV